MFWDGRQARRPKGSKTRLAKQVYDDLFAHWNEPVAPGSDLTKGREALQNLYLEKPGEYLRLVASTLPRDLVIENVVSEMSDDELDRALEFIRKQISGAQEPPMLEARPVEAVTNGRGQA